MDRLAPADQQGYGPAHLWQARRLVSAGLARPQARTTAEAHLVHALDGALDDRDAAQALLGEVYLAGEQLDQARECFARAVRTKPYAHLRLAQLSAQAGDRDRARGEAQLAIAYFQVRAEADPQDREARAFWADARKFLEDFPGAVAILEKGREVTHDDLYRVALVRVYLAWADFLGRDAKTAGERLRVLRKGLECDPANLALLNRLLDATRADGPEAGRARAVLQELLARPEAAARVHFALGVDAYRNGKQAAARTHWEEAHRLVPEDPGVANNLACLLAEADVPDLPRALELADQALRRAPNDANFRDTRGRILVGLGRWQEALADLEAGLADAPDNPGLHRALADAYGHLGDPAMAAEHQRLAKKPQAVSDRPNIR
jgi:tetratricopeptide (TPR) repeat protein